MRNVSTIKRDGVFPLERSKRILGRFHGIRANIVFALLGTVTPFCSCSSIPLFIGFASGGCAKCSALEAATVEALGELGMDTTIEHVTDFAQITTYGVMTTPALVVDGKVVSYGKVLKKDEAKALIQKVKG